MVTSSAIFQPLDKNAVQGQVHAKRVEGPTLKLLGHFPDTSPGDVGKCHCGKS